MSITNSIISSMLKRIIIVDDDDDFLHFVATMIKVHCPAAFVQLAHDGSEAMAFISRGTPPSVVITDIAMPRLDGNALCRMVREQHGDRVKIIAMTASRLSVDATFDAIVSKPFSIDALFAVIDQALDDQETSIVHS